MKFYLILTTIFLTLFAVLDVGISLSYGDFSASIVLIFFLNDLFSSRLIINKFAKFWFYFIFFLFLTSLFNFTSFDGKFLNIFKTNIFSLIIFIYVYSLLKKNKLSYKNILFGTYILAAIFLIKTWPEMQKAWLLSDNNFTNVNIFDSSLNLNTWGFVLVLFLVFSLYFYSRNIYKNISISVSLLLLIFIFFSYSRTAYGLSAFIISFTLLYVNKVSLKKIIPLFVLVALIYLFKEQLNFFNFKVSNAAIEFIEKKGNSSGSDLVNTRFYIINIKPLEDAFKELNVFQFFVGDGLSVQHSFVSHNLIVTGLIGFIIYLKRFKYTLFYALEGIKKSYSVVSAKFILLLLIVILTSDFLTNVSSFLPFAAYLASVIFALLFAEIDKVKIKANHD